jgi:hypothetical protein
MGGVAGWWQRNMIIYAHVMVKLSQQLGSEIPDSEFVIVTNDEPEPASTERVATAAPLPYFRYCKTDDHPDIPIPCWQLYQHNYSHTFLVGLNMRNAQYPWRRRKQVRCQPPGAVGQSSCTLRQALCAAAAGPLPGIRLQAVS